MSATLELNLQGILKTNLTGTVEESKLDAEGARLLQLAPNAIEWCTGPTWANADKLWVFQRSYQTIRDYFELRCPVCNLGGTEPGQPGDCWGRTRTYLESEVLLVWNAANAEDTCPKCRTARSELIEDGIFQGNNQMHLVVGMRAGKSMTAALIGSYVEHAFYAIGHTYPGGIHGYFDITPSELFEITFLASNQVQSDTTIFAKYTGYRNNSPWFRRYVAWIKKQQAAQAKSGMRPWRYNEGLSEIVNEHPNIRLIINALNSNSSGQAGRTRVHGFVDELARMKQTASAQGASEIYGTIESSLHTVRTHTRLSGLFPWLGSMISVTSPIARNDMAMQLLRKADDIPGMYARKYATWEFNPKERREFFEADYKKDPVKAERDFGANPPGAEHPLIHDEIRWARLAIDLSLKPRARFETFYRTDPTGQRYIGVKLKSAERMFDRRKPRFVVFDAGKNWDCFTGVAGHGAPDDDGRTATYLDWAFRIIPEPGVEVWFRSVVELMKDLKKFQYTVFAAFDHWNSVQLIQDLRDLGVPSEQEGLKDQDFVDWSAHAFEGLIHLLPPAAEDVKFEADGSWKLPFEWKKEQERSAPESVVIAELLELQKDPDSGKVYNPNKGDVRGRHSDDLARIVVHLDRLVQRAGFSDRYDDRSTRGARRRAEHNSAAWGGRGSIVKPGVSLRNWSKGRGW